MVKEKRRIEVKFKGTNVRNVILDLLLMMDFIG